MTSLYTEFLKYHRGYNIFFKAGTKPVHARSSKRPPTISTFVGVDVDIKPFIEKKQGSLSCLLC